QDVPHGVGLQHAAEWSMEDQAVGIAIEPLQHRPRIGMNRQGPIAAALGGPSFGAVGFAGLVSVGGQLNDLPIEADMRPVQSRQFADAEARSDKGDHDIAQPSQLDMSVCSTIALISAAV